MFTDKPVEQMNDDRLGRSIFAKEIADGLVNSFDTTYESVVVGINGPWGSGKSSLVNFIMQEIECLAISEEKRIITLRFNPWMFSGQHELQEIFLKELYLKLRGLKGKIKSASEKLAKLADYLSWLKYVHSGAGALVQDSKEFLEKVSQKKDLSDLKKELDNVLIESNLKLYITIDDIDRLTPTEITQIFQLVKLNANFANTFFILVYDQEVVVKALQDQFKENGRKYIEKIVQVDYTLPRISKRKIVSIFRDTVNSLFADKGTIDFLEQEFPNLEHEKFIESFTSLRDVYRFSNAIRLRLRSIYGQLNVRDFVIVETIRIFHYDIYEFIVDSKDNLTARDETDRIFMLGNEKSKLTPAQFIEKTTIDERLKILLRELFVLDGKIDRRSPESLIVQRRIANRNYFDRYFSLQLSDQDIPEELFESFIQNAELKSRLEILHKILTMDRLHHYFAWLEIKLKHQNVNKGEIIQVALNFSNCVHWHSHFNFLESDLLCVHRFCSRLFHYVDSLKERKDIIRKYFESLDEPTFASINLSGNILQAKGKFDQNKLAHGHMWFDLFSKEDSKNSKFQEFLASHIKAGTKSLFTKEVAEDGFLNDDELFLLINQVYKFHREFYDVQFPQFIDNEKVLLRILKICITSRSMQTNGGPRGFSLGKSQFFDKMDILKIYALLSKIDQKKFNQEERMTIEFFLKAHLDGFLENKYYLFSDPTNSSFQYNDDPSIGE